jgi:hypothetical protein
MYQSVDSLQKLLGRWPLYLINGQFYRRPKGCSVCVSEGMVMDAKEQRHSPQLFSLGIVPYMSKGTVRRALCDNYRFKT